MPAIEVLREELDRSIDRFDRESTKHKKLYRRLRYLVFGFTGLSTVLGGLAAAEVFEARVTSLAIVVATTLASVVTSVEGLRKPAELWIHERTIFTALKDLQREVEFSAAEGPDDDEVARQFERLQGILGASSEKWSRVVKAAGKGPPGVAGPTRPGP